MTRVGLIRVVVVAALAAAIAAAAWILTQDRRAYTLTATLADAGQLVRGNDVRVGASSVGEVESVDLDRAGLARLTLRIDREAVRLRRGTQLAVRSTSLTGSANHYVVLTPGGLSQPVLRDGAAIPASAAQTPVNVDQVLDALDAPTRAALRDLANGGAQLYGSRTTRARSALARLAPALEGSSDVLRALARDRRATERLVAAGAITAGAVADEREAVAGSIDHAATVMSALAARRQALSRSLEALPDTLTGVRTTLAGLRQTMDDLDPTIDVARPATRRLAPWLRRLRPLLSDAVPTVGSLADALARPGAANDLVDLLQTLPDLARATARTTPQAVLALRRSQVIADAFRAYTPDLASASARLAEVAGTYDANGHYLRAQPALFALRYDPASRQLRVQPDAHRLAGLQRNPVRCPGAAEPDGSLARASGRCRLSPEPVPVP